MAEKNRFYDFSDFAIFAFLRCDFGCLLAVEISNRPNKTIVSKIHENLDFEIIHQKPVESSGEQPPTLRKMFRGRLGVEKSIFLNPYFGSKRNFE